MKERLGGHYHGQVGVGSPVCVLMIERALSFVIGATGVGWNGARRIAGSVLEAIKERGGRPFIGIEP